MLHTYSDQMGTHLHHQQREVSYWKGSNMISFRENSAAQQVQDTTEQVLRADHCYKLKHTC